MAERSDGGKGATEVTIYGRSYRLRSEGPPERLTELAAIVDGKMQEVAESTGTADTLKVAIMAALNIADDYVQARNGAAGPDAVEAESRLARMVGLLDEALAG